MCAQPSIPELQELARAVEATLQDMQLQVYSQQQQPQQQQGTETFINGAADGSGNAVDAWLAVARVQEVLERVLELVLDR